MFPDKLLMFIHKGEYFCFNIINVIFVEFEKIAILDKNDVSFVYSSRQLPISQVCVHFLVL